MLAVQYISLIVLDANRHNPDHPPTNPVPSPVPRYEVDTGNRLMMPKRAILYAVHGRS